MLLRLLILAVLVCVAFPSGGHACTSPKLEHQFERATHVFAARIVKTEELHTATPTNGPPETIIAGTYRVLEVLKGSPPPDSIVKSNTVLLWGCTSPLVSGGTYIIMLRGHDEITNHRTGLVGPFEEADLRAYVDRLKTLRN